MRPLLISLLATSISLGGLTACAESKEPALMSNKPPAESPAVTEADQMFTGTIVYKNLEGGFFALLTKDNQHFTLRHLPKAYRLDGLVVEITGSINKDIMTITQFGDLLEVEEVKVLDDSKATPPETGPRKLKSL